LTFVDRKGSTSVSALNERSREGGLAAAMGISDHEVARRKLFLEFGVEDADRLTSVNELAHEYADPVIEDFYRYMLSFEATASFFEDPTRTCSST
jgi:rsbT co-antagonist protein RsbR